ncbi:hypothetical protein [Rufibacter tibetensis]|uniref:Uncharacterized protein n=1 Tax=Rufibacter tibetensis TaxID=512763 RepID=A0A0P0CAP9_9BACT|nr:hypothetical protein [Rufibacter tibetensis]ALJ00715.1 hypothetical protein DC20_19200 [Rufibacter tibetensis]
MQAKMRRLGLIASCLSMVLGGFGMIYCLPFLFSPVLEDLVGAGLPFVGGAILFAAGLISFSIKNKKARPDNGLIPSGLHSSIA